MPCRDPRGELRRTRGAGGAVPFVPLASPRMWLACPAPGCLRPDPETRGYGAVSVRGPGAADRPRGRASVEAGRGGDPRREDPRPGCGCPPVGCAQRGNPVPPGVSTLDFLHLVNAGRPFGADLAPRGVMLEGGFRSRAGAGLARRARPWGGTSSGMLQRTVERAASGRQSDPSPAESLRLHSAVFLRLTQIRISTTVLVQLHVRRK